MKYQILFSEKSKKKYFSMSPAEIFNQSAVGKTSLGFLGATIFTLLIQTQQPSKLQQAIFCSRYFFIFFNFSEKIMLGI